MIIIILYFQYVNSIVLFSHHPSLHPAPRGCARVHRDFFSYFFSRSRRASSMRSLNGRYRSIASFLASFWRSFSMLVVIFFRAMPTIKIFIYSNHYDDNNKSVIKHSAQRLHLLQRPACWGRCLSCD